MKKLWNRFKHWLIKKLGGYVEADRDLVVDIHGVYPMTVVGQTKIGRRLFKQACARDTVAMMEIENQIGYLLGCELLKQGLVDYSICENYIEMNYMVRGTIQVIPPKKRQGTELVSVLRGVANET